MKSSFNHLQINIDPKNLSFYKDLMTFLGWSVIFEAEGMAGFKSGSNGDIWFLKSPKMDQSNSDNIGLSHIAFKVESMKDVVDLVSYLKSNNVDSLYDTPRHRPEFAASEQDTYYQVLFESPDKVLFEVMYVGKK